VLSSATGEQEEAKLERAGLIKKGGREEKRRHSNLSTNYTPLKGGDGRKRWGFCSSGDEDRGTQ